MAKKKTYRVTGTCNNCASQQEIEVVYGEHCGVVMQSKECKFCGTTGFSNAKPCRPPIVHEGLCGPEEIMRKVVEYFEQNKQ